MTSEEIEAHRPMVEGLASYLKSRVPAELSLHDLVQAGLIAVWLTAPRYDASRGASLATFLKHRVRGAMLDEIRKVTGRKGRKSLRAAHVNIDWLITASERREYKVFETKHPAALEKSPLESAEQEQLEANLLRAVQRLPARELFLISGLLAGATPHELAALMHVNQSRISQLRTRALQRLRLFL